MSSFFIIHHSVVVLVVLVLVLVLLFELLGEESSYFFVIVSVRLLSRGVLGLGWVSWQVSVQRDFLHLEARFFLRGRLLGLEFFLELFLRAAVYLLG